MSQKKKIVIIGFSVLFLCVIAGLAYLIQYLSIDRREYALVLNGDKEVILEVFSDYEEAGAWVSVDGVMDETILVNVDSNLQTDVVGNYELTYWVQDKDALIDTRSIIILDTQNPVITLKGGDVSLLVGEAYEEPGFDVTDNYDQDLHERVEVSGEVDTSKEGEYTLTYTVSDRSNNTHSAKRTITVKKPKPIVHVKPVEEKGEEVKVVIPKTGEVLKEITALKFSAEGFRITGSHETDIHTVNLINKNTQTVVPFQTQISDHTYTVNVDVRNLENGSYSVVGGEIQNEALVFKLDPLLKLGRGRVGDKLVTFSYPNNTVEINVEDFAYQYDIALNVGHGGHDPGAINPYIYEKVMNLEVSLYEKKRYEDHGLSVYINRTSDTFGEMIGESTWKSLTRSAFSFGHYAAVSRIAYSNHHNSSASKLDGWEIIVSATSTKEQNAVELAIGSEFNRLIPNIASRNRIYTRDYDSEKNFSKMNGDVYNFTTYYAIIRIPFENYNARSVLFEPIYMSDMDDYRWYYQEGNWKKVSEVKIKHYVESLGINYIAPLSEEPVEAIPPVVEAIPPVVEAIPPVVEAIPPVVEAPQEETPDLETPETENPAVESPTQEGTPE